MVQEREKRRANHWGQFCQMEIYRYLQLEKSSDYNCWFSPLSRPLQATSCSATVALWAHRGDCVNSRTIGRGVGCGVRARQRSSGPQGAWLVQGTICWKPTFFIAKSWEIHGFSVDVHLDQFSGVKLGKNKVLPSEAVFRVWFWVPSTFSERLWTHKESIYTYPGENRLRKFREKTHIKIVFNLHVLSTSEWL